LYYGGWSGGDNFELVTIATDASKFDDIVCDLDVQQLASQQSTLFRAVLWMY
jgi:hypothetical protein